MHEEYAINTILLRIVLSYLFTFYFHLEFKYKILDIIDKRLKSSRLLGHYKGKAGREKKTGKKMSKCWWVVVRIGVC